MDEFCYATLSSNYIGSSDGDDSSQGFGKENTFFTLQSLASDGDKLQYEERVAYITRDVSRSRPPIVSSPCIVSEDLYLTEYMGSCW